MSDVVDDIMTIVETRGHTAYGAEAVSQYEHAVQSAMLAEQAGSPPALIAAALLHDIGHMVSAEGERSAERGVDAMHERIGQKYLRRWFGPDVTEPVALHVAAKRYLCAAEPAYRAALSPASERSLMLQGGPFTPSEMAAFLQGVHAEAAIALRRWDDEAKVPGLPLTPLVHFEPLLRQALKPIAA
jgi:phosphonate degradation associated HDIG domain protein